MPDWRELAQQYRQYRVQNETTQQKDRWMGLAIPSEASCFEEAVKRFESLMSKGAEEERRDFAERCNTAEWVLRNEIAGTWRLEIAWAQAAMREAEAVEQKEMAVAAMHEKRGEADAERAARERAEAARERAEAERRKEAEARANAEGARNAYEKLYRDAMDKAREDELKNRARLAVAMEELEEENPELWAFVKAWVQGGTQAEIGARLGISQGEVSKRLKEVRKLYPLRFDRGAGMPHL